MARPNGPKSQFCNFSPTREENAGSNRAGGTDGSSRAACQPSFSIRSSLPLTTFPQRPKYWTLPLFFFCQAPLAWGVKGNSAYGSFGLPLTDLRERRVRVRFLL